MPFPFVALIIAAVSYIAQSLLRPRPKPPKAATIDDFNVTAEETASIPYLAGTRKISPNITFFGDLQARPIIKTTGRIWLGFADIKFQQTVGYRYNVGMEHGLCYGPNVHLRKMTMDDKELFSGNLIGAPATTTILKEQLFGGEEDLGEGGVNVVLDFYEGNSSQIANPYMITQYPRQNGHRDVCYAVWRGPSSGPIFSGGKYVSGGGYLGKVAQVKPLAYYLERFPNFLGDAIKAIGPDANPANIIYDLATSRLYGGSLPSSKIDVAAFTTAAQTLFNESLGVSLTWDRADSMENLLQQVINIIDGALYGDIFTGKITLKLIRNDYDPLTLPILTDDDVLEIASFTRPSWDDTKNEVRLDYTSRADDYKAKPAFAQDLANQRIRNATDPLSLQYEYIHEATLAQKIAFREQRIAATPLARASLVCTRKAATLTPGSVFRWTTNKIQPGFSNKVMRVARVNYGRIGDSKVTLEVTEDVFALGGTIYLPPQASGYVDPVGQPQASPHIVAGEAPYWYAKTDFRPWSLVQQPTGSHLDYQVFVSTDGGTVYNLQDSTQFFTPVGTLQSGYAQFTGGDYDTVGFELNNLAGMSDVNLNDPALNSQGANLILFEDTGEICAVEAITFNSGTGRYTVTGVWRGALDTAPTAHSAGTRVWFFTLGQSISSIVFGDTSTVRLKHVPRNGNGELPIASAVAQVVTGANRGDKPYPPRYLTVNGSYTGTTHTGDVTLAWRESNRLTETTVRKQSAATVTPEASTTYTLTIRNAANTIIRVQTLITGTTYSYTTAQEIIDNGSLSATLTFELLATMGSLSSTVWKRTSTRV